MSDPYIGIPKRVRIGCYWFRIEVEDIGDSEVDSTFGHINLISQKIRVRPGMTAQNLANTFIHEVLHGIHWFYCAGFDAQPQDMEEDYTLKGANGLCAFWQDNPGAVKWWQSIISLESKV